MAAFVMLVFFVGYGALIFSLFRWARNRIQRAVQAVADALAAAGAKIISVQHAPGLWRHSVIELTLDGRPATFHFERYGRNYYLCSIAVPSAPLPHVLIRRERASDRLGKRMGFNREVQLGDPTFDDAAFIDTAEADDVVRSLLQRPDVRAGVLAVLATGYHVAMSPAGLRGTLILRGMRPIDPTAVPGAVAALEALAPLLPSMPPTTLGKPHWNRSPAAIFVPLAISMGCFMFMGAAAAVVHPLASRGDIASAFMAGGAVWVAAVVALFFFLRGGTRSLGQFVLAAFLLLIGVPTAGTLLTIIANSAFDGSPGVSHRTHVLALPKNQKKSNQVTVASWRPDHDELFVGVPRSRLKDMKVGDSMEVVTHEGAFGWEWIDVVK